MTLRILRPIPIEAGDETSSNVALETAWSAGTFTLGQQRRHLNKLWEVGVASTTQTPGSGTDWIDLGPANRYRCFDQQFGLDQPRVVDTITKNATSIEYRFDALTTITSMAFFGLVAQTVRIAIGETVSGDISDTTYTIGDGTQYLGSLWRWLNLPQNPDTQLLVTDLVAPANSIVEVWITNTGGTAECATLAMGVLEEYGTVQLGASRQIKSRSVRQNDGLTTTLVRRLPSRGLSFSVAVLDFNADAFWRAIEAIDGTAAVYAGPASNPELLAYGFHTSVSSVAQANGLSFFEVEMESV